MTRMEMLLAAEELAKEAIDNVSALSDEDYEAMRGLSDEAALKKLTTQFLEDALAETEDDDLDDDDDDDDDDVDLDDFINDEEEDDLEGYDRDF